jgi:hypothetical protein
MLRHFTKISVAFALALLCLPVLAETSESGSISGTAQVVLRPKATALRFQLVLVEQGDDMEATLKNLDGRCEAYRKALLKASAAKDSIRSDGPRLVGQLKALGELLPGEQHWGKGNWNQQVQQPAKPTSVPQQVPQLPGQLPPSEAKRAPRIALQARLTAEWPLQGETPSSLLVEADRIVLRAHDAIKELVPRQRSPLTPEPPSPNGQNANPGATPNANPNANPNAVPNASPFDGGDQQDVRELDAPSYVFVGRVSSEQLQKSRVEAFEKAKARAAAVALVAGCRIGALQWLSVSSPGFGGEGENDPFATTPAPYSTPLVPLGMGPPLVRGIADGDHSGAAEAGGADPSSLQYIVSVTAQFRLQKPGRLTDANP